MRLPILFSLFFLSGAAALVYEILWLAELGRLFGVTAHAAATTLAVFFLGLSAGSMAWGRRASRSPLPLRTYAGLELGIAGSALLYFGLVAFYRGIYGVLFGAFGSQPALFLLVKLLLAALILFPPAFFMGGTLPVMAQHMIRREEELGRTATLLYGVNTVGAALGAWAAGFHLPAALGYRTTYAVAIGINLVIAGLALALSRSDAAPERANDGIPAARANDGIVPAARANDGIARSTRAKEDIVRSVRTRLDRLAWLALASGFLTLALEVLWTRMFAQVLQNSVYTFASILTVLLIALAAGSGLAHLLCRRGGNSARTLTFLLFGSGVAVALVPFVFVRVTSGLAPVGAELGWSRYVLAVYATTALVLFLPGVVIGSVFPYLLKLAEGHPSGARPGAPGRGASVTIGRLVSINTIGAIAGSLIAGFALLDWIGLWNSLWLIAALYFGLTFALTVVLERRVRSRLGWSSALAVLVLAGFAARTALPNIRLDAAQNEQLVELWEGSHGTVAVTDRNGSLSIKVDNSYLLGTSGAAVNERMQAWIPLALHPDPDRVFFLGMGTGITAGGALDFPVESVTVAELNPDVIHAARKHLSPFLNGLFEDGRVRVIYEDGRNFLAGTSERYDVVVSDIFLSYRAGAGSLYTREHFRAIRDRLEPEGVFAQWLPVFDISEAEMGILVRTMLDVFPEVTLWRRGFSPRYPIFVLLGQREGGTIPAERFRNAWTRLAAEGDLPGGAWIEQIPLAAYVTDLSAIRDRFAGFALSTDDRTPLEYTAPITERNSKGAHTTPVLAWTDLGTWLESLAEALPPERDPYLAGLTAEEIDEVRAGLSFYQYATYERLGQSEMAARYGSLYQEQVRSGGAVPRFDP